MIHKVVFSPEANENLLQIYDYIASYTGAERAVYYIRRIESFCSKFKTFPKRGTQRDDLSPGLGVAGFERRVTIVFHIEPGKVIIDHIFYGGRNLQTFLEND